MIISNTNPSTARKMFWIALLTLHGLLLAPRPLEAETAAQRFDRTVAEMERWVPPVDGYLVSVAGATVYTDLTEKTGLPAGAELFIYRQGKDIVHPMTKQTLGKSEESLGILCLTQVKAEYSQGEVAVLAPGAEVKAGDRVRISAARLRLLALAPQPSAIGRDAWLGLQNGFFSALERSRRFLAAEIRGKAEDAVPRDRETVRALALSSKANMVVGLEYREDDETGPLRVSLFSGDTGLLLATWRLPVEIPAPPPPKPVAVPKVETAPDPTMEQRDPISPAAQTSSSPASKESPAALEGGDWESFETDFEIVALGHGYLTGSPEGELALTDGRAVVVYSRAAGGWKEIWKDPGRPMNRIISLDCGDVDGNGLDEIFITRTSSGRLASIVLEYKAGTFPRKAEEANLFYRVIRLPDGGRRLLAQEFDSVSLGGRVVRQYDWSNGTYRPLEGKNPGVPGVYGLGLVDVDGDGVEEVALINQGDYLDLYLLSGKKLWTSSERYGATRNFIDAETFGLDQPRKERRGLLAKGRILGADMDGDGQELIACLNISPVGGFLPGIRSYNRSRLDVWRWDGQTMVLLGSSREFTGYIADYALMGKGPGASVVIGLVAGSAVIGDWRGKIISRPLAAFIPKR